MSMDDPFAAGTTVDVERAMADASPQPYWLNRPEVPAPPMRPPLERQAEVDLLVVGSGFTGLWAAYEAASLGQSVLVVDRGAVGSGASGRCGGFINASITHGIPHGHARWPREMVEIVAIQRALWDDTCELIGQTRGGRDVISPVGKLTVATRSQHVSGLASTVELMRSYGEEVTLFDADGLAGLVASPTYLGGYHLRSANGLCDPARLAWILADVATGAGARIAEHVAVTALSPSPVGVVGRLSSGIEVRAGQALLCTNAYRPLLRRIGAVMVPVYDHVIVTEPLDEVTWKETGWRTAAGITDAGNQFHYYRPTPDGRILFGGWDASYHFGGRIDVRHEAARGTHQTLLRHLVATFPSLGDVRVSHAWGGPIDSTSRFTPTVNTAWGGRVGWAVGFTGLGVGASRFAALAALDLLAGRSTERTVLSMVRRQPIPFPPEPLRWLAIELTKRALYREDRTGRRGVWLRTLDRLGVGFNT